MAQRADAPGAELDDALAQAFYGNRIGLWALPLWLFLFVSRIWLVCQRGEMDDDPVAFALRDGPCLILLGLMTVSFVFAWVGPATVF